MIEITKIRIDGGTQIRVELNQDTVAEYAECYRTGVSMPPVTVYFDGSTFWRADGFHRYSAARNAGLTEIHEDRIPGSQREAILHSLGANDKHGLRRTTADKRKAVETMLNDPEWSTWSNEAIAKACCVSPHTVADVKKPISANAEIRTVRTVERNGTTYQQNTANIGTKPKPTTETKPVKSPSPQSNHTAEDLPTESDAPPECAEIDRMRDALESTVDEVDRLTNVLAANVLDVGDDERKALIARMDALTAENKRLNIEIRIITDSRDSWQNQVAALKSQISRQNKELAKLTGKKR